MTDWTTVIGTTSITTAVLLVLGFLARNLFGQILSKDIENYKIELQKNLDIHKINLQAEVDRVTRKINTEHQVRFETLHVKRAEVITELYSLLIQVHGDAEMMVFPNDSINVKNIHERKNELKSCFLKNRIYFTSELCEKIYIYIRDLDIVYKNYMSTSDSRDDQDLFGRGHFDSFDVLAKNLKQDIETEFRQLIGIEIEK